MAFACLQHVIHGHVHMHDTLTLGCLAIMGMGHGPTHHAHGLHVWFMGMVVGMGTAFVP